MDVLIGAGIGVGTAILFAGIIFYAMWRQRQVKPKKPDSPPMQGLGDLVSKVTGALKIPECGGCKERKAKLNRIIPFSGKATADKPAPTLGAEPPEWIREVEEQGGDAAAFLAGWLSCQTALARMELPNRQVFEACLAEWSETGRLLRVG